MAGNLPPEFTDRANCGGVSGTLSLGPGEIKLLKVGATALEGREVVEFEALDTGIKWGFENSIAGTPHDAHKSQHFTREFGEGVTVYFRNSVAGTREVSISEAN